ncbi:hypothetical protein BH23CHL8_BH23CHL8_24090 [soil metagenome]
MRAPPPTPLVIEQRIRARPETLFAYFTDPEAYRRWMGDTAELEPWPGGRYRVRFEDGSVAEGVYEAVEPPTRVVFTWGWRDSEDLPPGSTRVEVTLRSEGDVTVVRLEHHGLPGEAWRGEHEKGWQRYLGQLAGVEDAKEGQDADAQAHRG